MGSCRECNPIRMANAVARMAPIFASMGMRVLRRGSFMMMMMVCTGVLCTDGRYYYATSMRHAVQIRAD